MRTIIVWLDKITNKHKMLKRWKRIVTVLAAIITFATTYALILPAITVEKNMTDEVGGMYLEHEDSRGDMWEENAPLPRAVDLLTGNLDEEILAALVDGEEAAPALKTLKAYGHDYTVILTCDETSGIPEDAVLKASEIAQDSEEYQTYLEETKKAMGLAEEETLPRFAARFFDIKIMVGDKEFTPDTGVSVEITYTEPLAENPDTEVNAVHFADEKAEAEVIEANTTEVQDGGAATVEFTAESFSVYGVIYTVDFYWNVDGKMYNFSIPGGGFISFEHLVEVLGIGSSDTDSNSNEFVADVESVEFSNPELVWVGKVSEAVTVGGLKEANELKVDYSLDLTEEQIAEINAQTVEAEDWALISVQPFETEETLTVTMKNGEKFTIKVTDEQIVTHFISDSGDLYDVTVTYGKDAKIPAESYLKVTEFDKDSEEYDYALRTVLADKNAKGELADASAMGFAALDISIYDKEGNEIEPAAPVHVDMKIKALPDGESFEEVRDSLEIQHHVETEDGVVVETVFSGTQEGAFDLETNEDIIKKGTIVDPDLVKMKDQDEEIASDAEQDASFEVSYFSTYSLSWQYYGNNSAIIHYGYMNDGNFVEFPTGTPSYTPNYWSEYNYLIYDVPGYRYSTTRLGSAAGTEIKPMLHHNNGYSYYADDGWFGREQEHDISNNQNIYVIYEKESEPPQGGTPEVPETLQWPDQENPPHKPELSKSSINNGDDTNTITLSIKAPEKKVQNFPKANVIVVMDLSASMDDPLNSDNGDIRLALTKAAIDNMADTLMTRTASDGTKVVKMALITFGAPVRVAQEFTDNLGTFKGTVDRQSAYSQWDYKGGTNWEGALYEANRMANADPDAVTFVVFVTDGDPTFRISRGELSDADLLTEQTSGRGTAYRDGHYFGYGTTEDDYNGDRYGENLNFAVDQVKEIVAANKHFYAVGISSDVTNVKKLCTDAGVPEDHASLCSDSDRISQAFDSIVDSISATLGFSDMQISDGITALTHLKMKVLQNADPSTIKYYRYGGEDNKYGADEAHRTEWTTRGTDGCDPASYDPATGSMVWNMGDKFQLEDDVTYQIAFRVWPSQTAYDLIADLNNETRTWDSLDETEQQQLVVTGTDPATGKKTYALKTNTDSVTATYERTYIHDGNVTTVSEDRYEAVYTQGIIEDMNLKHEKIMVRKKWEHGINESHSADFVKFRLLVDGEYYQENGGAGTQEDTAKEIEVSNATTPKWENSIFIATGIMDYDDSTGEMDILEDGHDYALDEYQLYENGELSAYAESYEFHSQTVHPMRINGVLTFLIRYEDESEVPAGCKTYVLKNKKYYVATDSEGILTGTNYRKAELDITKLIDNHSALTASDLNKETFTYRVTLEVPNDADVSLITAYEFVKRTDGTLYYIDGYKIGEGPVTGDETRFSEKAYRWYTVSYGTKTVEGNSVSRPIGEGFVLSQDGLHKTITMDITLKRNEVLRFTNLPTGTNYTIEEYYANYRQAEPSRDVDAVGSSAPSNLENQGYSVAKIVSKSTGGDETTVTGTTTVTGSISEPNKRYYNQFTNELGDVADADLPVTKHLENYAWTGERYYFKLIPAEEGNPMPARNTMYITAGSGEEDKTYSFGKIRYTQAGTYTYTIQETDKNGVPLSGMTGDDGIVYGGAQTVTVTVGARNGKLAVTKITNAKGEVISSNTAGSSLVTGSSTITNALNEVPIKKIDSVSRDVIQGAVFELYLNNREKQYLDDKSRVLTQSQVETIIGMGIDEDGAEQLMQEANITSSFTIGEMVLRGIPLNKTYVIRETKAPSGYVMTSNDFEFSLNRNTDTNEVVISIGQNQEHISLDSDGVTITIDNTPGAALPKTGGPGSTLIYFIGIMLVTISGALLAVRRMRTNL